MKPNSAQMPPLTLSLIPPGLLMGLVALNVVLLGDSAPGGANQLALLLAAVVAAALGVFVLGRDYREIQAGAVNSIMVSIEAVLILLMVGALIGLWILSGVVPAMIAIGIRILHPSVFLLASCLICSVVSLAVGSSWSTMGTVGVALMGIGKALGFPEPLVAGAIISGAYFGDKTSPLSDTTNLAPAVAGTDLFTHIRHMMYTTIPAYGLTVAAFALIGLFFKPEASSVAMGEGIRAAIEAHFHVRWWLMGIPAVVIGLAALRVPALPALFAGAALGAGAALWLGPPLTATDAAPGPAWASGYLSVVQAAYGGVTVSTGHAAVDALLSRGGMLSMVDTVILILMAMLFGGVMEAVGMLQRIGAAVLAPVRGAAGLIAATIGSCIVFNITASEQYLSIILGGRMLKPCYEQYGLDPRNLSRALEDGGTVTSVLVPWNTCGAFASSVLAVPTLAYLPFCLFNLISPVVAVVMARMGVAIVRRQPVDGVDEGA